MSNLTPASSRTGIPIKATGEYSNTKLWVGASLIAVPGLSTAYAFLPAAEEFFKLLVTSTAGQITCFTLEAAGVRLLTLQLLMLQEDRKRYTVHIDGDDLRAVPE